MLPVDTLKNSFPFFTQADVRILDLLVKENVSSKKTENQRKKITFSTKALEEASKCYFREITLSSIPSHFYFYEKINKLIDRFTNCNQNIPYTDQAPLDQFEGIPLSFFEELNYLTSREKTVQKPLTFYSILAKIDAQDELSFEACLELLAKPIEEISLTTPNIFILFYLMTKNPQFFHWVVVHLHFNRPDLPQKEGIESLNSLVFNRCIAELNWAKAKIDSCNPLKPEAQSLKLYQEKVNEILEKTSPYQASDNPYFFKILFRHIVATQDLAFIASFQKMHPSFFKEECEEINELPFLTQKSSSTLFEKVITRKDQLIPSLELIFILLEERKLEEAKILLQQIPPSIITHSSSPATFLNILKKLLFYKQKEIAYQILATYRLPLEIVDLLESMAPTKEIISKIVSPLSSRIAMALLGGIEEAFPNLSSLEFAELTELFFLKISSEEFKDEFRAIVARKFAISQEMGKMEEWIEKIHDPFKKLILFLNLHGSFLILKNCNLDPLIKKFETILQSDLLSYSETNFLPLSEQGIKERLKDEIDRASLQNTNSSSLQFLKQIIDSLKTSSLSLHLSFITFRVFFQEDLISLLPVLAQRYFEKKEKESFLKDSFLILMAAILSSNDFRLSYQAASQIENRCAQEAVMLFLDEKFSEQFPVNPFLIAKK